jgi:isopenicillin N synthase-like dioxygenase
MQALPVIDVSPLVSGHGNREAVAEQLGRACRENGFFYVAGHGVHESLQRRLAAAAARFFALAPDRKNAIRMALGGRAWRGYFPVGGELTSGRPDLKEGLYLGTELPPSDPRVRAGLPLHGANLFPQDVPELRPVVLAYLDALTALGHALMEGLARSLGLAPEFFAQRWMRDPTVLFRLFHYPPASAEDQGWGVGEHTDYGVLTVLLQDDVGGLQVKSRGRWIDAPPIPDTFVCNIGDMLDRMTRGLYRSTAHRVRNVSGRERYSFPFFFDPGFDADIRPLPLSGALQAEAPADRWDGADVLAFEGTYGDYLRGKVSKVFPDLFRTVLLKE